MNSRMEEEVDGVGVFAGAAVVFKGRNAGR